MARPNAIYHLNPAKIVTAPIDTSHTFPYECTANEYAFFFWRARSISISGTMRCSDGGATSSIATTLNLIRALPDVSCLDESDAWVNGFYDGLIATPGDPFSGVHLQTWGDLLVNTLPDTPTADMEKWAPRFLLSGQYIPSGSGGVIFTTDPFTGGTVPATSFTLTISGNDLVTGDSYSHVIPVFRNSGVVDMIGSLTITPNEFWSFDGLYDTATGAHL